MSTKKQSSDKELQPLDKVGTETLIALLSSETRTEAAEKLGIARKNLYERIAKYQLDKHLEVIPQQALGVLRQGSLKAAENYIKKIDHRDARVSLEASNQVLDRIGLGVKTQQTNVQINVSKSVDNDIEKYQI